MKSKVDHSGYKARVKLFKELCVKYYVPVPEIGKSLVSDPCDYTAHDEVRLNIGAAPGVEPAWHVAHVFGHYLADLHTYSDEAADLVADAIAHMIVEGGSHVQGTY